MRARARLIVARAPGMNENALERLLRLSKPAAEDEDVAEQHIRARKAAFVTELFEHAAGALRDHGDHREAHRRIGHQAHGAVLEQNVRLEPTIAAGPHGLDRLVDDHTGLAQVPGQAKGRDAHGQQFEATCARSRVQAVGPAEQPRRGLEVAACLGAPAGPLEPLCRGLREGGVLLAHLLEQAEGLFEVVAEQLLELEQAVAGGRLDPAREALVQTAARLLRHARVGGVVDQQMPEAVGLLAAIGRRRRPHEPLGDERPQRRCRR